MILHNRVDELVEFGHVITRSNQTARDKGSPVIEPCCSLTFFLLNRLHVPSSSPLVPYDIMSPAKLSLPFDVEEVYGEHPVRAETFRLANEDYEKPKKRGGAYR